MTKDKFGETLRNGDTVVFLRDRLLIIGDIEGMVDFTVTVIDEADKEAKYKLNGRKVVKISGEWKTKAGEE